MPSSFVSPLDDRFSSAPEYFVGNTGTQYACWHGLQTSASTRNAMTRNISMVKEPTPVQTLLPLVQLTPQGYSSVEFNHLDPRGNPNNAFPT
jgi:hypothetical protein